MSALASTDSVSTDGQETQPGTGTGSDLVETGATEAPSEGSLTGSFVAILTPFFAIAAGWLAGVVAKAVPGVNLDKGQITAFMVAATAAAIAAGYKWLHGWQQHEQRVNSGHETAVKLPNAPKPASRPKA